MSALGQQGMNDLAEDVGEAEVAPLESVSEFGVLQAEAVQDGSLKVVDVDLVFGDVIAEVVGGAVAETGFDAAAGHPDGEGVRVMIAADEVGVFRAVFV